MLPEDNRRGDFFEADEYQAVLDNLPEYLRPVIQTAYIIGWRINSESLRDRSATLTSIPDFCDSNPVGQWMRKAEAFR